MLPFEIFRFRLTKLHDMLRREGIDCVMIRTVSDFKYFTGVKWLRPALLVPAEGVPKVFPRKGGGRRVLGEI